MVSPARSTPCPTEDTIAEFLEGGLSGDALASFEEHVGACPACARLVARVGVSRSGESVRGANVAVAGTRVGRYVLRRSVGAGAMGRVYVAHDPTLGRDVALKVLHPVADDPDHEARLLREAKALGHLAPHPEVITVYDAGSDAGELYIAMELVEGGTLTQWCAAERRSWRDVVAVFLRAGSGLAHAHAGGLVHRDFKPDNVLVGTDGRIRVTDFGLARPSGDGVALAEATTLLPGEAAAVDHALTRTGTLVGTPAYMAPEQLAGGPADARTDIFSFCVAFYEALYGERPFHARTLRELAELTASGSVSPPPRGSAIPARLRRALLVGLSPKPADRYGSMPELLAAVQRAVRTPRAPYAFAAAAVALGSAAIVLGPVVARFAARQRAAPATASATAPAACTARSCAETHGGEPYVCRAADHTCVPIASPDCTPMYEPADLTADDTVWLGAMFPTKGPATEANGPMNMAGTEFARQEIARETRLIEGSNASLHLRRVALVGCDDSQDAMRAAKHLVDDVGVPAILGFRSGPEVSEIAGSLLIGRQVLSVASLTSSPQITRLPQPPDLPRMVWRTTYSVDRIAEVTARMIGEALEPRRAPGGATRVTLVRPEGSVGLLSFAETFYRQVRFNGRPAVENGSAYQEITFAAGTLPPAAVAALVERVAATRPTFVVVLGAGVAAPLAAGVEARSPGAGPTYVLPGQPLEVMREFMGHSAERRRRVFSVQSASHSMANARFVIRYNEAHADKVTRALNPGVSYDAFYLLAYATFALGGEPVSGPSLARAFGRLVPPGPPIEVGPTNVYEAIGHLSTGGRIDLQGESTALDFDLKTGEGPADFVLICSGVDEAGGATGENVESGVTFGAKSDRLEGSLRCP